MLPFFLTLFILSGAEEDIILPSPKTKGDISVEEAIERRRSIRDFTNTPLTLEQISQLVWSAQGITDTINGYKLRASPSAGALYPLELYILIPEGVYHYIPSEHMLSLVKEGDYRKQLYQSALKQSSITSAPMNIVITAIYERTTIKYRERGVRYVHIEAGHAAENIHLQAVSLGLASVPIGAFYDDKVKNVISCSDDEVPLYIIPVGKPLNQ